MRLIAIDPSLTASGVATYSNGAVNVQVLKNKFRGMERLAWIRGRWKGILTFPVMADVVLIEGYSFGQQQGTSQMFASGELGCVLRLTMHDLGIPYLEVAPGKLKVYATGDGRSDKGAMLAEAIRRLGYRGSDDNEADALWLLAMARAHYATPAVELPKTHTRALDDVEWPALSLNTPHPGARAGAKESV